MLEFKNSSSDRMSEVNYFEEFIVPELFNENQWSIIMRRYNITQREAEVTNLIFKGSSYNKISKELKIQSGTVKVHLRNVYRKVKVKNRLVLLLTFLDYINRTCSNL
jgi:ATP/maltotriose-dependent transcriptional regulator MalT